MNSETEEVIVDVIIGLVILSVLGTTILLIGVPEQKTAYEYKVSAEQVEYEGSNVVDNAVPIHQLDEDKRKLLQFQDDRVFVYDDKIYFETEKELDVHEGQDIVLWGGVPYIVTIHDVGSYNKPTLWGGLESIVLLILGIMSVFILISFIVSNIPLLILISINYFIRSVKKWV